MSLPATAAALSAGIAFATGALLCTAATAVLCTGRPDARQPTRHRSRSASRWAARKLSPQRTADLLLAGIAPGRFLAHQALGAAAAGAAGIAVAAARAAEPLTAASVAAVCITVGWLLPGQRARDTARQRRHDLGQAVNAWMALTAQQVNAGAEPAAAMITAAKANNTLPWQLLARHLHAAQNERLPAAAGLAEIVRRYRLESLDETLGALSLAAQRGTRLAAAVVASARNEWQRQIARERETAQRHNQIIALPATAIALGLAAILIYPPLVSLTGGIIATGPNGP